MIWVSLVVILSQKELGSATKVVTKEPKVNSHKYKDKTCVDMHMLHNCNIFSCKETDLALVP